MDYADIISEDGNIKYFFSSYKSIHGNGNILNFTQRRCMVEGGINGFYKKF